jgi:ssDNA-binding Zn-finger/Zn-ribbon topoisomerase 1
MSNNTINYTIYKDGKPVGYHTQNVMCRICNDGLMKFQPAKDYTIVCEGYEDHYDGYYEDEDYSEEDEPVEVNLEEWLSKNPSEFTHKKFSVGDTIKLTKRRGLVKVIEVRMGNFMPEYLIELEGVEIVIQQGDIIPIV